MTTAARAMELLTQAKTELADVERELGRLRLLEVRSQELRGQIEVLEKLVEPELLLSGTQDAIERRTQLVLKVLEESGTPLGFSQLLREVQSRVGGDFSKNHLTRVLKDDRIRREGSGRPKYVPA